MLWKDQPHVVLHFLRREEFERKLRTYAFCLQPKPDRKEGVLRDEHVRGPVCDYDENTHGCKLTCGVIQQIDRGRISPMKIVEEEDDGTYRGQFAKKEIQLPLKPLLRSLA